MTAGRWRDLLRLSGSVAANRVMHAELLRLVKRSRFDLRLPSPERRGSARLLYPFSPELAWVAGCHHRSSSRIARLLAETPARRLDPLHDDLEAVLSSDERLDGPDELAFSVEVGDVHDVEASPLQVRGAVKSAILSACRRRGRTVRLEPDAPGLTFHVERSGADDARRTCLAVDVGGGPRHLRGQRAARVEAPLRETLAAQLVLESRWDARVEPLVDPMAGGGTIVMEAAQLARAVAVRQPEELPLARLPDCAALPLAAPPLFADTRPRLLAADVDDDALRALRDNLEAAGLKESEGELVVRRADARGLTPELVERLLGPSERGVFCFNPPHGRRLGAGDAELERLYRATARALQAFEGWRTAVLVAGERFAECWGSRPARGRPAAQGGLRIQLFEPRRDARARGRRGRPARSDRPPADPLDRS